MSTGRAAIEAPLRDALVGRELLAVRYVELDYGDPGWDAGRFHSIDYGVELDVAGGATWAITWRQESWNERLLAYPGTLRDALRPGAEVSTWDVSDRWHARFAGAVASVETAWTRHEWGPAHGGPRFETRLSDGHTSDPCLVTILLRAADEGCAVVTLGGDAADGQGTYTYLADNVAVFLSLEAARTENVLLPGDPGAIP